MYRNLLTVGFFACFSSVFVGCIGRPPMYQGSQPYYGQPQYITPSSAPAPYNPSPGPVAFPQPDPSSPTPIASPPPDAGPSGGGISLTPAARTQTQYNPSYTPIGYPAWQSPSTFAPMGVRYADAGQTIDGRPVPWNVSASSGYARPLRSSLRHGSLADRKLRRRGGRIGQLPNQAQIVNGIAPTPHEDLKYRGGRTIKDLTYINIYVGGKQSWSDSDRKNIDWALNGAMTDPYLNHVIMQYFNNQPVTSTYKGSFIMDGYRPQRVTQANVKELTRLLYTNGYFRNLPLNSTVVNFMLPRGVVLADPDAAQQSTVTTSVIIPHEEESSSLEGLGGYHGSIHVGSDTVYYSVGAYSERLPNGQSNGIPVFDESWKNVVATFYHELQEARTDPDVDDAIATGQEHYIGWTSDSGEEIADYPVSQDGNDGKLDQVFIEVPLANGSGKVPVQLCYSNAVHGPEGPITLPHGGSPLPIPPANPQTPSSPATPPPSSPAPSGPSGGFDPALDLINQEWDHLSEDVKLKILKLIQTGH